MTAHSKFNVSGEVSEISGDKVADILKGEFGPDIAAALNGCRFYRVDPDQPVTIKSCDQQTGRLSVIDADGKARTFALNGGYLYLEPQISALLDQYQALDEQHEVAQLQDIQDFGFVSDIRAEDLNDISLAVRSAMQGPVPAEEMRRHLMKVMSAYRDANAFADVTIAWVKSSGDDILPDVLIKLLPALRTAGRHQEAIEISDFLRVPCHGLTDDERRILLTIRAAACLDSLEYALEEAGCSVKASRAIGPSEHLDLVSARLERLSPCVCKCACR